MTDGCSPQAVVRERRRPTVSTSDDHAIPRARASVTRRAKDVEAFPTANHDVAVDAERKQRRVLAVHLARVKERVLVKLAARDGSRHQWARRAVVVEEGRLAQGNVLRLVVHVL